MTANPAQGVRIERLPGKALRCTEAGRIALPLWVINDGVHLGDGELVLTYEEARGVQEELGVLLTPAPPEEGSE